MKSDVDDVGRRQLRLRARLAKEASESEVVTFLRDDDLHRDIALERGIAREVHDTHSAPPELAIEHEVIERLPRTHRDLPVGKSEDVPAPRRPGRAAHRRGDLADDRRIRHDGRRIRHDSKRRIRCARDRLRQADRRPRRRMVLAQRPLRVCDRLVAMSSPTPIQIGSKHREARPKQPTYPARASPDLA